MVRKPRALGVLTINKENPLVLPRLNVPRLIVPSYRRLVPPATNHPESLMPYEGMLVWFRERAKSRCRKLMT